MSRGMNGYGPVTPDDVDCDEDGPGAGDMTSLGLTRQELRDEVDELIRNAYYAAWRESRRRPDAMAPGLEIDWTQPGGVRITEIWGAAS